MGVSPGDDLRRVLAWRPHAAVVYGSGLAALPDGGVVEHELEYEALDWPRTSVPGHANVLRLARLRTPGGGTLRLALACGRAHRYEGWSDAELEAPVRGLAAAGVTRVVLTNSCGGLGAETPVGGVVVCGSVVDLQRPPETAEPPLLQVCGEDACARVAAALGGEPAVRAGTYVSVRGPQFETPAEAEWLAGYGDVVGMSAAPEVRAALAGGVECCLLGLVANRAAAAGSHEDVLEAGARLGRLLASRIAAAITARWPDLD